MRIDWVKFGEVSIDGNIFYSDVIAYWNGKIETRGKDHLFDHNEFLEIAERNPENIIIGKGFETGIGIPEEVFSLAKEKGIELFLEDSKKAAEIFNAFVRDGKKTVAVIHTMC